MKVLMATDGSPQAATALRTALQLLTPSNRIVDLICVAPAAPHKMAPAARARYEERILRESTRILKRMRTVVGNGGGGVSTVTEVGSPAGVIVSRSDDYDLTVVGAKGRRTAGQVGLGPVASRVVEHAPGPVLIGRELRGEGAPRILVAVDGSEASFRAVETLATLFQLESAEVCLMHVAETPWVQLGLEDEWSSYSDEDKEKSEAGVWEKEMLREGETAMEQARDLLRGLRLSVSTRLEQGNPANEILSEAERGQYDLIVVGATSTRDLKRRMLGSVSSKIAWNAPCSVLIVREPESID
jgi:nucleotide-binding universal stress UspA family protein